MTLINLAEIAKREECRNQQTLSVTLSVYVLTMPRYQPQRTNKYEVGSIIIMVARILIITSTCFQTIKATHNVFMGHCRRKLYGQLCLCVKTFTQFVEFVWDKL